MQGKSINDYTLHHLLGRGGMAEVWYAENSIEKAAAVKILREDFAHNPDIVERFRNEAKVMVKLNHPNIRQVYGYGDVDGRPAIIMEYLDGDDLKARMKHGERFGDAELRKWWNQMADALNYTHGEGVVHRDIKPSNIFIDTKGNVRLLDFGIAKVKESISSTQTGAAMGTLLYMSPEQIDDVKRVDYRTDVYSLAVTFVHLLTGKAPYDATQSSERMIMNKIVGEPVDMSGIASAWCSLLQPYLAKERDQRPALTHFSEPAKAPDDTEETVIDEPKQEFKPKTEPKSKPQPNPDTKPRKKWPFIVGTAAAAMIAALVMMLTSKAEIPSFEELKTHTADEFKAKQLIGIGDNYYNGAEDYPQDYAEAASWYRMAAEQENATAQVKLGSMYDEGYGVSQDYAEAAFWYRMAANKGKSSAKDKLKACQEMGYGVTPQSEEELKSIIAERMEKHGSDCNLNDIDVSKVTDMDSLFFESQFNGDISKWDVSNVTDMDSLFFESQFNGDISKWDVSNVTNMGCMFADSQFNGDISKWDVSKVTDMSGLFFGSQFNGDISKWDVSNVTDMTGMFNSSQFNGDISKWDVSNVTDMRCMFYLSPFNGDISKWDVSKVTNMYGMFIRSKFNGDISQWNVSNVTDMSWMFWASEFNGDISQWNVSNVTNMGNMFRESQFNGDISQWNVSKVTYMSEMFYESQFNGDISQWNVSKVTYMSEMFKDSPLEGREPSWYRK